ncbi:MAG TPA: alpha/beta fold hydrolase [Acidimicrobiia bacterium]|nr:alpha/beta fold hydrolase [Acidimicrobiia bacterium]
MTRERNFSNWAYWRLHLDSVAAPPPPPEVEGWRARTRLQLEVLLGRRPEAVPLELETTESVDCGPYRRERIIFDTEATMSVPAFLLTPHARRDAAPGPAVLAIHGHGPGKSRVCGIEAGEPGDDYAHQLAMLGYVVLAPDLRGFGERADWMPPDKYHCDWDLVCATMAGVVPLERNLWDMQRALDVLSAHPLVDGTRIAVAGLSFGATCALFLAALDDRVRAAVVSGYLSSWRAAHTIPWNMCGSQVMPGQLGLLEHLDVAALVAPRPMLVESGTADLIFPVASARATVSSLEPVYAQLGASDGALVHDVFEGDHQWHGELVPKFLQEWL